jgi:hypothetical protein
MEEPVPRAEKDDDDLLSTVPETAVELAYQECHKCESD